jgi:hypothetical protein
MPTVAVPTVGVPTVGVPAVPVPAVPVPAVTAPAVIGPVAAIAAEEFAITAPPLPTILTEEESFPLPRRVRV